MRMSSRTDLDLFAVQTACGMDDYLTADAFESKIFSFLPEIQKRREGAQGHGIVVFPEDIGLFLAVLRAGEEIKACRSAEDAFLRMGRRQWPQVLGAMLRRGTFNPKTAFWFAHAEAIRDTVIRTFSRFALESRTYVVAGSAALPHNKYGLVLRPYAPREDKVYNLSFTFGPDGRMLGATAKVNLVPGLEDGLGLAAGRMEDAAPVDIGRIKLATAICYDGFRCAHTSEEPRFQPLVPYFDRMGADVVAQPAANPWPWDGPWHWAKEGAPRLRREQWLEEGALSALSSAQKVRFIVNPHLAGNFLDLHFEGRSAIYAREGERAFVLAEAETIDGDEIVHAHVRLNDRMTPAASL